MTVAFRSVLGAAGRGAGGDDGGGLMFVSSGDYFPTDGSNITAVVLDAPGDAQEGDLLIASVTFMDAGSAVTVTPPAGWTHIRDSQGFANDPAIWTFYRIAGTSEPGAYEFTLSGAREAAGGIVAFRGADETDPISASVDETTDANIIYPEISVLDGGAVFWVVCRDGGLGQTSDGRIPTDATAAWGPSAGSVGSGTPDSIGSYKVGYSAQTIAEELISFTSTCWTQAIAIRPA